MSTVQEFENAVEQLPRKEFLELASFMDRKRQAQNVRDRSAFLAICAPGDEGLYDDENARRDFQGRAHHSVRAAD